MSKVPLKQVLFENFRWWFLAKVVDLFRLRSLYLYLCSSHQDATLFSQCWQWHQRTVRQRSFNDKFAPLRQLVSVTPANWSRKTNAPPESPAIALTVSKEHITRSNASGHIVTTIVPSLPQAAKKAKPTIIASSLMWTP